MSYRTGDLVYITESGRGAFGRDIPNVAYRVVSTNRDSNWVTIANPQDKLYVPMTHLEHCKAVVRRELEEMREELDV